MLTIVSDRFIIWRSLHHRPDLFSISHEGLDIYSELLQNVLVIGCRSIIRHARNAICFGFVFDGGGRGVWVCGVAVERVSLLRVALTWWCGREVSEDGMGSAGKTGNVFCMLRYTQLNRRG